jgi:hypothetical protein
MSAVRTMHMPAPADAGSPAATPSAGAGGVVAWYAEGFSDALGDRLGLFDTAGPAIELLRFNASVAGVPGFEALVRARIDLLASFRHPGFARVRALRLLDDPGRRLALASDLVAGERLSAVLRSARASGVRLDATSAVWMLRHLLPAIAALHETAPGVVHGLLDPDRVVLTAGGDVVITEHVFGDVVDRLAGDVPDDVTQAALLAIAVLVGRPLRRDEQQGDLARLVSLACASAPTADVLRPWLARAVRQAPDGFRSAREAYHALEELLPGVWGAWPARLLPAPPGTPVALPVPASDRPAPLALPPAVEAQRVRLRRANRTLTLVALAEAVCIAGLIAAGVGTPSPVVVESRPVEVAGLLPSPATAVPVAPSMALAGVDLNAPSAPPPAAAPAPGVTGWLVVESDVPVRVYVNGRLLGTATRQRFGLPEGQHLITFANDDLAFRSSQPVRIVAGRSVLLAPKPPAAPAPAPTPPTNP